MDDRAARVGVADRPSGRRTSTDARAARAAESGRPSGRGGGGVVRAARILGWIAAPIVVLLLVRAFLFEPFGVPSDSMRPTIRAGDQVIVDKRAYPGEALPRIGDIVVLEGPGGATYVKRVVAVGGQRVEIRDGVLFVDRRPRRERYVDHDLVDGFFFGPAFVPTGAVFVLGDDRGDSEDSRDFGPVPADRVVGRVVLRIPSLKRLLSGD